MLRDVRRNQAAESPQFAGRGTHSPSVLLLTVLCSHCVPSALPAQHTVSLDKAQDTRSTGFPGPPGEGTVLYTTPAIIFSLAGGRQGLKTTLFEWLAEVWGIVVVFLRFSNLLEELTELSKVLHVGLSVGLGWLSVELWAPHLVLDVNTSSHPSCMVGSRLT